MKIDTKVIREKFQSMAGRAKVTVKIDRQMLSGCHIKIWGAGGKNGFDIRFNPSRIRSQKQLDAHLDMCLQEIAG